MNFWCFLSTAACTRIVWLLVSLSLDLLAPFSTLRATTGHRGYMACPLADRSGSQEIDTLKTVANVRTRQFEEPFWVTGPFGPVSFPNCYDYDVLIDFLHVVAIWRVFLSYRPIWACELLKLPRYDENQSKCNNRAIWGAHRPKMACNSKRLFKLPRHDENQSKYHKHGNLGSSQAQNGL